MKNKIRLVVSDIDGTLIRAGEEFPAAVKDSVKALSARGILFTFASGRLPYMITPYAVMLGVTAPICACNGTLLYALSEVNDKTQCKEKTIVCSEQGVQTETGDSLIHVLERHPVSLAALRPLAEAALSLGMTVLYAINGMEYCMRETEASRRKRRERGKYHPVRPVQEEEWGNLFADKLNILDEQKRIGQLAEFELPLEKSGICEITHYGESGIEIVAAGYGKAYGVKQICRQLGISTDEVLAVGDNENDDEMIRLAGLGCAVENAEARTKACADVVASEASGKGVAELIERFCL